MDSSAFHESTHYANLLSTVGDLRSELERSVAKMQSMEEQNRILSENSRQLKDELVETRKKYNEAQDNYMKTVAGKFEEERKHEEFLERVKLELAEKTKEFETLRDKFAPQDIDYIRIKVQEELEIPHKQRILAMETEVEKHRDLSFKYQRELERCKADYEAYSALQQKDAAAVASDYEASMTELQAYVSELKNRNYDAEKENEIRKLKISMATNDEIIKSLTSEVAAIRTERDEVVYMAEQNKVRHGDEMSVLSTRLTKSDSDRIGTEKRLQLLQTELDFKDTKLNTYEQELDYANSQIEQFKLQIVDLQGQADRARDNAQGLLDGQRVSYETERAETSGIIESLQTKVHQREETIRRLQREVIESQIRVEAVEADVRRVYNGQLSETRQRADQACLALADTRDKLGSQLSSLQHTIDIKLNENETFKGEIARLRREKGHLHDKVQTLETKFVSEKSKYTISKRDLATKLAVIEDRERRLRDEYDSKVSAFEEAIAHDEHQAKEIRKLQHRIVEIESDTESRVRKAIDAMRDDQENMERLCLQKLEDAKRSARDAIAKEKKKSEMYREKALESHARNKALVAKYQPDL